MLLVKRLNDITGSHHATLDFAEYLRKKNRLVLGYKDGLTQPVEVPGLGNQIRCIRVRCAA